MAVPKILVVEDENIVAKDIQGRLNSLGYAVSAVASSGEDAIKKAAETRPHLVLMDIVLKGQMDGIEAAEEVRRRFNIPVIYLTAYGDNETLERAKSTEPFGYILKPFDEREVRTAIEIALYNSQMERKLRESQERLAVLHEVALAVTSSLELRRVLELLLEKIDLLLPYSVAMTVRLLNREQGEMEPVTCRNLDQDEWMAQERSAGGDLASAVVERRAPVIVEDVRRDALTRDLAFVCRHGLVSYLGVPLIAKGGVLGVLGFFTQEEHHFAPEEIEFLTGLARQAAIAIHNSQLYERVTKQADDLERANQVKSEFLSLVSHELKTPLNVIMGYTNLIREKILPDQDQILGRISKYAHHLLLMIDSLLDVTRIEAGAVPVVREETSLENFLEDLRSFYAFPLGKEIRLVWDFPSGLPRLSTDSVKLRHILQNLVDNAIKFTDKGQVAVSARWVPERKAVEFKVSDSGIGIAPAELAIIFERFRQADSSSRRTGGGVGLGLYIVKTFTEMLGGKVSVDSAPGSGTTFTVTLPCE